MEWDCLKAWTPVISAGATLILAGVAVWAVLKPLKENRRIRDEDKKSDSMRRSLDDVQHWIREVLRLKAESGGAPGDASDRRRRATMVRTLISNKGYIQLEVERINAESPSPLGSRIDRLLHILEDTDPEELGAEKIQQELEDKCVDALKMVSTLRTVLKL